MSTPLDIEIKDVERLEFTGRRNEDGSLVAVGQTLEDWPKTIRVSGVVFRREETDDVEDAEGTLSVAWYVPKD